MRKNYLLSLFLLLSVSSFSQKFEFGIGLQQNFNRLADLNLTPFDPAYRVFSIDGASSNVTGYPFDTIDVYLNKFSLEDNFELPLFLRYQFKNRFFIELNYSQAAHELNIEGNTNYTDAYFVQQHGTFEQFKNQAELQGLPEVTLMEYDQYINGYKHLSIGEIASTERFWLTTLSANFGMKLFPHKSIRPWFSAGFAWKHKRQKQNYDYLDFDHQEVRNYSKVAEGIDRYADNSFTFNTALGLEFYRFRFGAFAQFNVAGNSLKDGVENGVVVNLNTGNQTHESAITFGFNLNTTLFSKYVGKDVHYDELSDETIAISNIRKKKQNWSIGARLNYRMLTDLTGYYDGDDRKLNVLSRDSAYYAEGTTIIETERIQAVSFGKIKRIDWKPPVEVFGEYHFTKRLFLQGAIGYSSLAFDIETDEFAGLVTRDSTGKLKYLVFEDSPSLRPGVYRKNLGILTMTHTINYTLVDRPSFQFRAFGGFGLAAMVGGPLPRVNPAGVNNLPIYDEFNAVYQAIPGQTDLYANTDPIDITISPDPNNLINQFPTEQIDETFETPEPFSFSFNYFRVGVETAIDRFTISAMFEANIGYMDGFMLNDFRSAMLGVGYRFINR